MKRSRRPRQWALFTGAIFLLGFAAFVVELIQKVRSGRGGEIYQSLRGYRLSYVGVLVVIALVPVIVIVASIVGWWQRREERDFERKYAKRRQDT